MFNGFRSRVSIRALDLGLGLGLGFGSNVLDRGHEVRCWIVKRDW